ncbi:MAG: hypothetical protein CL420_07560 [Acidimicrobiaceae bacterium]|jgi:hypothetical protein|nr:hypothetical protein [Acidimicrobiaceae bacterium]|tara:strand:- start:117 stop:485 length:369 start_codon:yes stop_codon:yes gene_type:complete
MDDQQQIEYVINTYIDSMNESNADMVRDAFHENAKITGYLHGELKQLSTEEFAGFVSSQQPSPNENGEKIEFDILNIEIEGSIAHVKIRDKYLGITFLDILSLLKDGDHWKIYNKLFNVESE